MNGRLHHDDRPLTIFSNRTRTTHIILDLSNGSWNGNQAPWIEFMTHSTAVFHTNWLFTMPSMVIDSVRLCRIQERAQISKHNKLQGFFSPLLTPFIVGCKFAQLNFPNWVLSELNRWQQQFIKLDACQTPWRNVKQIISSFVHKKKFTRIYARHVPCSKLPWSSLNSTLWFRSHAWRQIKKNFFVSLSCTICLPFSHHNSQLI